MCGSLHSLLVLLFLADEPLPLDAVASLDERFKDDDDDDLREDDDLGVESGSRLASGTRSYTNFSSSRNVLLSIESITMSSSSGELCLHNREREGDVLALYGQLWYHGPYSSE